MNKILENMLTNRIIRFVIVGGMSTVMDFAIYMLLSRIISVNTSKAFSMMMASAFSYFVNKIFTFENQTKTNVLNLTKFYIVFGVNLLTNTTVNCWMLRTLGNKFIAFIVATLCGMIVNYLGQSLWVFKDTE